MTTSSTTNEFYNYVQTLLGCNSHHTTALRNIVNATGSYFAGSAVLAMVDKTFVPNDLDIYAYDSSVPRRIADIFGSSVEKQTHPGEYLLYDGGQFVDFELRNIKVNNFKIQVILCKTPIAGLTKYFDIDICDKVINKDGFSTRVLGQTFFNMKLYSSRSDDTRVQKTVKNAHCASFRRAVKYMKRGYTLGKIEYDGYRNAESIAVLAEFIAWDADSAWYRIVMDRIHGILTTMPNSFTYDLPRANDLARRLMQKADHEMGYTSTPVAPSVPSATTVPVVPQATAVPSGAPITTVYWGCNHQSQPSPTRPIQPSQKNKWRRLRDFLNEMVDDEDME